MVAFPNDLIVPEFISPPWFEVMSSKLVSIVSLFSISPLVVILIVGAEIFPEFISLCVFEVIFSGALTVAIFPVLIKSR